MQHPLDSHRVLAKEPLGIGPAALGNGIADVGCRDFSDKTTTAIKSSACRWSGWGFAAGFGVAGIQLGKRVGGGLLLSTAAGICQRRSQETPAPKHQRSAPPRFIIVCLILLGIAACSEKPSLSLEERARHTLELIDERSACKALAEKLAPPVADGSVTDWEHPAASGAHCLKPAV